MAAMTNQFVNEELLPNSDRLYIFFGGISGSIGMPPFEFYQSSRILQYSKLFIRDLNQSWYQRGVAGLGIDAFAIGKYLSKKIAESGATEIIFIGNSMGGYAALLFCAMLKIGRVIAFAPQTFLTAEKRLFHHDERWGKEIDRLLNSTSQTDILDLKQWIQSNYPTMEAQIHVSTLDALDCLHALELEKFPNIKIYRYEYAGHGLVARLRDDGALARVFNS